MQEKKKIFLVDDQRIANMITKKMIETSGVDCDILAFEEPKNAL